MAPALLGLSELLPSLCTYMNVPKATLQCLL